MAAVGEVWQRLWTFRSTAILVVTPLALLPVVLAYQSAAGRCAYAIMIMAVFWVTEAIPMAVTALLPLVLMPWLGVVGSKQICVNYFKDANVLMTGSLMVALAVEKCDLHKRIALRVLLTVGAQPKWLLGGIMVATGFLSMWMSSTAVTAMMVPIVNVLLLEMENSQNEGADQKDSSLGLVCASTAGSPGRVGQTDSSEVLSVLDEVTCGDEAVAIRQEAADSDKRSDGCIHAQSSRSRDQRKEDAKFLNLSKGMLLSVAFSANIGGTGTLPGAGTNMVFMGQMETLFGPDTGINYSSWFIFCSPNMLVMLILTWLWMTFMHVGPRALLTWRRKNNERDEATLSVLRREHHKLGRISFDEKSVLVVYVVMVIMWLSRKPGFTTGWSHFTEDGYVTDACVAVAACVALFVLPSKRPSFPFCRQKSGSDPAPVPALLDWSTVQSNLCWGVILVRGGGFALADACKVSGLSSSIANACLQFEGAPPWALVVALCVVTAAFTEVASNSATASILLPIMAEMARSLRINPIYICLPVSISATFAFMLPVATPPNTIVFAYGRLRTIDMVKSGAMLNVLCIIVLNISINTWGYTLFNLGEFPAWAEIDRLLVSSNVTTESSIFTSPAGL